jgi:hypothetical protein
MMKPQSQSRGKECKSFLFCYETSQEQRAINSPPLGPKAEMERWKYIRFELRSIVAQSIEDRNCRREFLRHPDSKNQDEIAISDEHMSRAIRW